jgi:hypothetical protein
MAELSLIFLLEITKLLQKHSDLKEYLEVGLRVRQILQREILY